MSFYPIPGGFVFDDAGSSKTPGMATSSQAPEGEGMVCDMSEGSMTALWMARDDGTMKGGVSQTTSGATASAQHETPLVPDVDTVMAYDVLPKDIETAHVQTHTLTPPQNKACVGASQLVHGVTPGERNGTSFQPSIDATLAGNISQCGPERMGGEEHIPRPLSRDVPTMEDLSQPTRMTESVPSEQESEVSDLSEHARH